MGMSSSQARLLTLTARLHSIEWKAQKIEAEKLRLANDSDKVYDTYLERLEQTKLVANVLAQDGSLTAIDLTAKVIYDYKTLQNQYSLITKDNKALIPQSVSDNYRNTASLSDFLNAYGLNSGFTQTIHHEDPNPVYIDQEKRYQDDLAKWEINHKGWEQRRDDAKADHDAWVRDKARYDIDYEAYLKDVDSWDNVEKPKYDADHAAWEAKNPELIKTDTTQRWWVEEDYSLGNDFHEAATSGDSSGDGCYGSATKNPPGLGCYQHILAHLIEYTGTTSSKSFANSIGTGSSTLSGGGWCDNNTLPSGKNSNDVFKQVSQQLEMGIKPKDDGTFNAAALTNDYQKLISKYNADGSLKTMKQWAIDLNYICANSTTVSGYDSSTFGSILVAFQDSLEGSLMTFKQEVFDESVQEWRDDEPQIRPRPVWNRTLRPEPTFTETEPPRPNRADYVNVPPTLPRDEVVNHTTFNDKDKAQWYINLWYKMEGLNETPIVMTSTVHDDATNTDLYIYSCDNKTKSNTNFTTNAEWNVLENENYIIIPDNKLNDPKWLRNTVVEGYVLIQEFDTEANEFKDTSVSVTTKIDEVTDEVGVKKAEAQYEADMKAINKKDRQYDTELAKFETERNAIKEEIDSLKNVAKENVDRTFKLFS